MNETELEFHILNLLDGNLSNEEFMALQEELLRNIQARRVFKRFAHLHSNLETRYVSTAKIQQMGVECHYTPGFPLSMNNYQSVI